LHKVLSSFVCSVEDEQNNACGRLLDMIPKLCGRTMKIGLVLGVIFITFLLIHMYSNLKYVAEKRKLEELEKQERISNRISTANPYNMPDEYLKKLENLSKLMNITKMYNDGGKGEKDQK